MRAAGAPRVAGVLALTMSLNACDGGQQQPVVGAGGAQSVSGVGVGSTGAAIVSASSSSGNGMVGNGGPCEPEPLPEIVPDGWTEYTDWTCTCRFYVPATKDALPAPPTWEPCPASAGAIDCRAIVVDWPHDSFYPVSLNPLLDRDEQGRTVLAFRKMATAASIPHFFDVITEPDGPVRNAMIQLRIGVGNLPGCRADFKAMRDGWYIRGVDGWHVEGAGGLHWGAIGGPIDELHPKVIAHWDDDVPRDWSCGSKWIVRSDPAYQVTAVPWNSVADETLVHSPGVDPNGLPAVGPVMRGDFLFFDTAAPAIDGINLWDPIGGWRYFLRWPSDFTQGAAEIGTDGVDLVWTYGEGKTPTDSVYPTRSIMTAPYTTDPAALRPRRLRSDINECVGCSGWVVGCGYAANEATGNDIQLVRLSDGQSWVLPFVANELELELPVGISCDDVFVYGKIDGGLRLARIALASLGPGIAPD